MKKIAFVRLDFLRYPVLERFKSLNNYLKVKYYSTPEFAEENAIPVKKYSNIFLRFLGVPNYYPDIYKELNKFNPDLVNSTELYTYCSYSAVKWAKKNNKKSVVFCFETLNEHPVFKRTILRRYFTNYVLKNADAFHVATLKTKEFLLRAGVSEEKILLVKCGFNTQRFKPYKNKKLRAKLGLSKKTVLFIGRLTYEKGIKQLLDAFKDLKEYNLLILGNGRLKNYVKKKAVGNIVYIGTVHNKEIHNYFNCADILCVPSIPHDLWEEQYGEVFVQAMSSGLPVITTRSGAIPEVVSNNEGDLITPLSVDEIKEKIINYFTNPKLLNQKSKNARKRALLEYDSKKNAKKLFEEYKRLKLV